MSNQIQIETPVTLNWEATTLNGEVYKQFSPAKVELNIKHILDLNEQGKLKHFFLLPERREYLELVNLGVSLSTGVFYINGIQLDPRPDVFQPKDNGLEIKTIIPKYRLIFFRRHQIGQDPEDGKYKDKVFLYLLGWQTTFEGQNYQRIMFINPKSLTVWIQEKR